MPNLVLNLLTITPSTGVTIEDYQKLRASIFNKNDEPDMNVLIPIPEELMFLNNNDQIDDFVIENWGTNWNIGECADYFFSEDKEGNCLFICFTTAWSPPDKWLKLLVSQHPFFRFEMQFSCLGNYYGQIVIDPQNNFQESYEVEDSLEEYLHLLGYFIGKNDLPSRFSLFQKIIGIEQKKLGYNEALDNYNEILRRIDKRNVPDSWLKKLIHQIKSFWRGR